MPVILLSIRCAFVDRYALYILLDQSFVTLKDILFPVLVDQNSLKFSATTWTCPNFLTKKCEKRFPKL